VWGGGGCSIGTEKIFLKIICPFAFSRKGYIIGVKNNWQSYMAESLIFYQ
jgi:hypothetical protein